MICGTFQKIGLDQATSELIAESYKATNPAPLNVSSAEMPDGTWSVTAVYPPCPNDVSRAQLDLSSLTPQQQDFANRIAAAFAQAHFGTFHQAAAIANAIVESELNPVALSLPPEHSVGLFQLNMTNGLGQGFTQEQLQDPMTNIQIIVSECQKVGDFMAATDLIAANRLLKKQGHGSALDPLGPVGPRPHFLSQRISKACL